MDQERDQKQWVCQAFISIFTEADACWWMVLRMIEVLSLWSPPEKWNEQSGTRWLCKVALGDLLHYGMQNNDETCVTVVDTCLHKTLDIYFVNPVIEGREWPLFHNPLFGLELIKELRNNMRFSRAQHEVYMASSTGPSRSIFLPGLSLPMCISVRRKTRLIVFVGGGLLEIYWSGCDVGAILDFCVESSDL